MISVIIPAYNEKEVVGRCIQSILADDFKDYEIIVVDDGSTDETGNVVAARFKGVRLLRLKDNEGICRAVKHGIDNSGGDIIAKIDADSMAPEGWLRRLNGHFKDPSVSAVGGSYEPLVQDGIVSKSLSRIDKLFNEEFMRSFSANRLVGTNWAARKSLIAQQDWEHTIADETVISRISEGRIVYDKDIKVRTEFPSTLLGVFTRKFMWGQTAGSEGLRTIKSWIRPAYFTLFFLSMLSIKSVVGKILFATWLLPLLVLSAYSASMPAEAILSPIIFLISEFAWCLGALAGTMGYHGRRYFGHEIGY